MRVIVAEPARLQGHWDLSQFVHAASTIVGDPTMILSPIDALGIAVDAVLWDSREPGDPAEFARAGIPTVRVVLSDDPPGSAVSARLTVGPQPDSLRVSASNFNESARQIAEWLGSRIRVEVTLKERHMLEVVLKAVRDVQDTHAGVHEDPEEIAQVQAAADTIEIHLKAPKPSRGALAWAVTWLSKPYPAGIITGVAATYLVELMNHFPS